MSSGMGIWEEEDNADIYKEFIENSKDEEPTDEQLMKLIKHDNFVRCKSCGGNVLQTSSFGICWVCELE
tara:strand:+ start:145 stop:351 length:207 start_codon:yes stop_codon:yes gene_type:complete